MADRIHTSGPHTAYFGEVPAASGSVYPQVARGLNGTVGYDVTAVQGESSFAALDRDALIHSITIPVGAATISFTIRDGNGVKVIGATQLNTAQLSMEFPRGMHVRRGFFVRNADPTNILKDVNISYSIIPRRSGA